VRVTARRPGGEDSEFEAVLRIDGAAEVDYERHGGILQMVLREMLAVAKVLEPLGIPLIALKGAAYIAQGLRCADGRLPEDLDLMVPRDRLDEAERALVEAGWASQKTDAYDQHYYRAWSHELPPMRFAGHAIELDVHHTILPPVGRVHLDRRPVHPEGGQRRGAVGDGVMQPQKGAHLSVRQAGQQPQLPQRPGWIQPSSGQRRAGLQQLGFVAGSGKRVNSDVVGEIERRSVDPQRPAQPPARPVQQLPEAGEQMQSGPDRLAGSLNPEPAIAAHKAGSIDDDQCADVPGPAVAVPPQGGKILRAQPLDEVGLCHDATSLFLFPHLLPLADAPD